MLVLQSSDNPAKAITPVTVNKIGSVFIYQTLRLNDSDWTLRLTESDWTLRLPDSDLALRLSDRVFIYLYNSYTPLCRVCFLGGKMPIKRIMKWHNTFYWDDIKLVLLFCYVSKIK